MSSSWPTYSRVPELAPDDWSFICLGAVRIVQFGQTRFGWYLNKTPTTTQRANMQMYFGGSLLQTPVEGSSKAGIPLKHPRWELGGVHSLWGLTGTTCGNKLVYGQVVNNGLPDWVVLRWAPASAPAALQGKWISPPLQVSAIPIVALTFSPVSNICK